MKSITTLMTILGTVLNVSALSIVVTSDITTNTIWDSDSVIIDKEFFEVKENARLTVASGVNIVPTHS